MGKSKFARGRICMKNASQEDLKKNPTAMVFQDARSWNFSINEPLLQAKTNELASQMDIEYFKCNDGWLS